MARKTKLLSWIAAALVALTTVVAARTLPAHTLTDHIWPGDFSVSVEISGTAGAGVATSWQAP